jgi:predicted ATPase
MVSNILSHNQKIRIEVGKTTLAEQLKKRVIQDFGYFVSGKLNEASRMFQTITECYNPIVVALSELCCQIAAAGEQRVQSFKTAAAQVMSSTELSLLQESIPTLEKIFGRNKKALTISGKGLSRGQDAESSFEHILRMFLFAGASERPLVLFLDDLHWASPKLVQILRSISSNPSPFTESRLMLLCAYRHDNEGYHRPFLPILDEIREDGATLTYVAVSSVSAHAVNQIVARELDVTIRETETLADVIHSKTGGNVLFAAIFFKSLLRDQLVAKDGSGRWHWDESQIIQEVEVISIQQFLIKTIDQLPPNARELLKVASCLGSAFTETMLWSAANMTRPNVESSLRLIERMGLVTTSATSGQTRFTHDKMREAADTLIAESERDSFHLGVGQRLLHWLPEDQQEDHLMLIVYQVSRGVHLLDDPEDKVAYSKLFLKAGRKAATLAEFSTASALVRTAVNLLGKRCWKDHYDQSLRLYNLLTEIEYYSGNLDQVDLLVAKTIKRSHNLNDAFVAHFTRIYSMGTRGCTEEALDEGLTHLTKMGFHLPHNPGLFRVARAFLRCQGMLRGQDDSDILNLPLMHDKSKLAAMRLLIVITGFAFYVREGLLPVTAFLLIKTTLKHGLNDMSACLCQFSYDIVSSLTSKFLTLSIAGCVGFACLCFIQGELP